MSHFETLTLAPCLIYKLIFFTRSMSENLVAIPTNTIETVAANVIRILNDGPAVSLSGSPTVSPMTAAL